MNIILAALLVASPLAAQTQADLNRAGASAYRAADAALNAQYHATMAVMANEDRGRTGDLRKGYAASLLASQRAWLAYRDAQCTLAGYAFRGGSAEGMAKGQCLTALTRTRTAELKQMQTSFGPK